MSYRAYLKLLGFVFIYYSNFVAASTVYSLDDGTGEGEIGLDPGADLIFLNQFDTAGLNDTIDSISVAWGVMPDTSTATVVLWNDPDNDGNPADAVLLASAVVTVANNDTDIFNVYDIPDTVVSDIFFAGVLISHAGASAGEGPASLDETASLGQSWVAAATVGSGDIKHLTNNTFAPLDVVDNYGIPGNWMVRANGLGFAVPLPGSVVLFFSGLIGLAGVVRKTSRRRSSSQA